MLEPTPPPKPLGWPTLCFNHRHVNTRPRLGDILINMGLLDELQLKSALSLHRYWSKPLGWAVLNRRFCTEQELLGALEIQTGLRGIDLDNTELDPNLATAIPAKFAKMHRLVPVRIARNRQEILVVAVAAPGSLPAIDEAQKLARTSRVLAVLATDSAIERAIARLYGSGDQGAAPNPMSGTMAPTTDAAPIPMEAPKARPVLVYGWTPTTAKAIAITLSSEWVQARVVGPREVLQATEEDIIVAPLPALEALRPSQGFRAKLVVACGSPDPGRARARAMGAHRVLAGRLDFDQLVQAVRSVEATATA
jgi:type IV pilus assembly protein PilB